MRRLLLLLSLFIVTVLIVAIYLVSRNGTGRIVAAETACPQVAALDYSHPFLPDQEIPDLCAATEMAPSEAVTYILRRSIPVRTYIANEIVEDCGGAQSELCSAHLGDATLESAIDGRLDAILPQSIEDSHDFTSAGVSPRLPFFYSGFLALRSDNSPHTTISFEIPSGTPLTLQRIEEQYGAAPKQKTDPDGYLSLEYINAGPGYTSDITFLVNPTSTEVHRITVAVTRP